MQSVEKLNILITAGTKEYTKLDILQISKQRGKNNELQRRTKNTFFRISEALTRTGLCDSCFDTCPFD